MQYTHLGRTGLEIPMSKETLEQLDEIFPCPGGAAPEAYAW